MQKANRHLAGHAFILALFLAAGFLAYGNSLSIPLIGDDVRYLSAGLADLQAGLFQSIRNILPDRPFLSFTIWLNYRLCGANYPAFRAVNVVLQCLSGFTLFHFLGFLGKRYASGRNATMALFLSLLFTVHPAANQSVNLIIQRGVLLAGWMAILSLWAYLRFLDDRRRGDYLIALLAFLIGILSKPWLMVLPLIFLLAEAGLRKRPISPQRLKEVAPFALISLLPLFPVFVLDVHQQLLALKWHQYLSVQARVTFIYYRLWFAPIHLHYLYDIDPDPSPWHHLTWLAIAAHLAIVIMAIRQRRKRPLFAFSLLATYLAFLPESGVFPIEHLAFEQRTYFPFIFLFIAAYSLLSPRFHFHSRSGRAAAVGVLALFCLGNRMRNAEIDTPAKWVLNTIQYDQRDVTFNMHALLGLYQIHEYAAVERVASILRERFPEETVYEIYRDLYRYSDVDPRARKKMLETISRRLLDPSGGMPLHTRVFLNEFVLVHLREFVDDRRDSELSESLISPQIPLLIANPALSRAVLRKYNSVLNYWRREYQRRIENGERLSDTDQERQDRIRRGLQLFVGSGGT